LATKATSTKKASLKRAYYSRTSALSFDRFSVSQKPVAIDRIVLVQAEPQTTTNLPKDYFLLGIDSDTGETFGNGTFDELNLTLCASFDGVSMIRAGRKGVLFPLRWLYEEFPQRRKVWESQRNTLYSYAQDKKLPFREPFISEDKQRLEQLLATLSQRYGGKAKLRDLSRRNGYKSEEVRKLASAFPDSIVIESVVPTERGGRPSESVRIPVTSNQ
jgi:hypothetical protein